MTVLSAAAASARDTQLIVAAIVGIAAVIVLITAAKVHPFLALIIGSGVLAWVARFPLGKAVDSFTKGAGSTFGSVGLLVALGAMIGGMLAQSGGADRIVESVVDRVSAHRLPWAMAGIAALIALPLFFEVGVVLLVPVVVLIAQRTRQPLLRVGIPALAGLSVLHGLVPPHPGPLAAIGTLKADLGLTLALGLIIAIPTLIIAGPIFGGLVSRWVRVPTPAAVGSVEPDDRELVTVGGRSDDRSPDGPDNRDNGGTHARQRTGAPPSPPARTGGGTGAGDADPSDRSTNHRRPAFWPAVITILLPVVLMLARAIGELTLTKGTFAYTTLDFIGTPVVALLAGAIVAMFTLGYAIGWSRNEVSDALSKSLPPIAGIMLIVAAGGGLKQVLVDAGVGNVIADAAKHSHISALLLGWLVAVGIRVATGSATVATITAAGIVSPLAAGMDKPTVALLALAVGCGSLFFSHVNDAGFWLVKEYFGMSVGQTIKTWSIMETVISVVGFVGVLILHLII